MTSPSSLNDEHERERIERGWIASIRAGEEPAFESMYRTYVAGMCAFANSYTSAHEDAEEIVQDVFRSIWEQRFTIEMNRGMGPYLYAAVRNRALNVLRDRRAELSLLDRFERNESIDAAGAHTVSAENILAAKDFTDALDRTIATMPPRCREVFSLLRYKHLSYAEVAVVLAISRKTVEIHMGRALSILRDQLAPWIEELRDGS
jgi:RNA polymerase sigma-70 factor (ECF subfamily)